MKRHTTSGTFCKQAHISGPVLPGLECAKQFRFLCINGTVLTLNVGDDCVAKPDGRPCIVRNIVVR